MKNMKKSVLLLIFITLLLAGVFIAGCTSPAPAPEQALPPNVTAANEGPLNPDYVAYQLKPEPMTTDDGYALGDVPSPITRPDVKDIPLFGPGVHAVETRYDLRDYNKVSPVEDQNPFSTCWAFATYGSLESTIRPNATLIFSEKNLVNLARPGVSDAVTDLSGGIDKSMAYLTRWAGPVDEATDPYPKVTWTGSASYPAVMHVQNVILFPARSNRTDTDNIKLALEKYGAVDSALEWSSDLFLNKSSYAYYMPASHPKIGGGHDVTIIGWDDSYPATNFKDIPPGNGAWIVKNSWGTNWGIHGFFYVSYYDKYFGSALQPDNTSKDTGIILGEPVDNYKGIYYYDPLGECAEYYFGTTPKTSTVANRFTATSPGTIKAIGFFSTDVHTSYKAEIYRNPTDGPAGGTPVATFSGTLPYMGYSTIVVPSENQVRVNTGDTFSVVLTLTNPLNPDVAAVEMPRAGYCRDATSHPGESYFSTDDGRSFKDLTTTLENANFCIKVYTT